MTQTESPIVKRPSRRPPVLPVRPSTEETPQPLAPTLPERPVLEKPVRRPTLTLPQRPSLDETENDDQVKETTEVPRPSRRPRPPQLIRPSVARPEAFSNPAVNRPGLFARPPLTRPEPIITPSVARPQESARPFAPVPPNKPIVPVARPAPRPSPVSPSVPVPVKVEKPERVSLLTLATQRPPIAGSHGLPFSFGIRPVTVAQNLVAESPYRRTGGYSSIKMFGINAGKKHVSKPKKTAYKEKRRPVTNTIGFSSEPTSAQKLPRVDLQAEQAVAAPTVQAIRQGVPESEPVQTTSTAAEELIAPYEEQTDTVDIDEAAPEWQAAAADFQPQETAEPQMETTEAHQMTTTESRWESPQSERWISEEQAPTEQAAANNIETESSTRDGSLRDQEAAAVTDRILSEIEDWTPMVPDPVDTRDEYQYREEVFSQPDETSDHLIKPEISEQYYAEPKQTVEAEVAEPEANTEASGYQQLEYYIEDPADLQASDSVWSPVVSGVVRVPVRPVVGPPTDAEYQTADEVGEPVQPQVEDQGYAVEEPVEWYPESAQETSLNIEEYEAPEVEPQVVEPLLHVGEYTPTAQEPDLMDTPDVIEAEAMETTNRPLSSRPLRPLHPQTPQQFFEEGSGPRPAGGAAHPSGRPRPPRPGGGWMSGLLSGLFGGRPSGAGSSGGSSGGSGGLLAGLFRRPTSPAPAPARDELPPVQSDPILAAMFGAPGGQAGAGEGEVPADAAAGRQDATEERQEATVGRPERDSPAS